MVINKLILTQNSHPTTLCMMGLRYMDNAMVHCFPYVNRIAQRITALTITCAADH